MRQKRTSDWASLREGESASRAATSAARVGFWPGRRRRVPEQNWFTKVELPRHHRDFKVSTTRSEDSEAKVEMHAKLAGKVNINFKSDYFPMERWSDVVQIEQIRRQDGADRPRARQPAGGGATRQPGAAG